MESVQFFADHSFDFLLNKEGLHFIEHYLSRGNKPIKFSFFNTYVKQWFFKRDTNEQFVIQRGIRYLISIISNSYSFFINFDSNSDCKFINKAKSAIVNLVENSSLKLVPDYKNRVRLFHYE